MLQKKPVVILIVSCLLPALIIVTSITGIFGNETYIRETPVWRAESIGQDKINLFIIVPLLLFSGVQTYRQKINYSFIFGGCLLFLIYTFTIYCFNVHFNSLFIIYCTLLGLSFYSFFYLILDSYLNLKINFSFIQLPVKSLRAFLLVITSFFYFLWLREDVTAILLGMPSVSLTEAGLFTNPVHVLDLAVFLPGFIILAHLLKKGTGLGKLLMPYVLIFCILIFVNIGALFIMMNVNTVAFLTRLIGFLILPVIADVVLLKIVLHHFKIGLSPNA